jgi:AbrB family looped-hinge helix DNA binding protein
LVATAQVGHATLRARLPQVRKGRIGGPPDDQRYDHQQGKTTIPKRIRYHLGLKPGDRLRIAIEEGGRVVLEAATIPIRQLRGIFPRPKQAVTLEEIDDAIREHAIERFRRA